MKSECRHKPVGTRGTPASSRPTSDLSVRRKWLFRLFAVVIVPLLALAGLEATLRLAGYGYNTSFFEKIRVGQKDFLTFNSSFGLRFFPPQLARWPDPIMLAAKKPPGTYRIFILGESAAEGDPRPAYGAGRYLETLLRERFPGEKFEIVNLGITAIDSHVIVPIARECARYQGDLWIIYMGNNEMIGPFGAASVFGAQAPPLMFVRLSLAIQQTRVGQLTMAVARKLKWKTANASWKGMKMFLGNQIRPDDPRREMIYRNFQRNLEDIVCIGVGSGAKILLNTVAVNLKDCPPFASMPATNLSVADRAACDRLFANGSLAEGQGNFAEAAQLYRQAAWLDPRFAELQFRWGDCLLRLTNFAAAREHFQLACNYDALPFRADSRINGLIAQTGRQLAGPNLVLFDVVAALETNNPTGICGQELFYEHAHFNFNGNYRLGRAWAERIEPLLPAAVRGLAVGGWASQKTCERRLGLTDLERHFIFKELVQRFKRPPLNSQPNNARRLEAAQREESELRQWTNATAVAKASEIYMEAIQRTPDDYWLHENFGGFLTLIGDSKQAIPQWQQVIELLPHDYLGYYKRGALLVLQGQWAEAELDLSQAVALHPTLADGWFLLGYVHGQRKKFELALQEFEQARRLDPHNAVYSVCVGKVLFDLDRHAEAIQHYRQALQLDPDCVEAHFMLGYALAINNAIPEAEHEFEETLRLDPSNEQARFYRDRTQALMQRSYNPKSGR